MNRILQHPLRAVALAVALVVVGVTLFKRQGADPAQAAAAPTAGSSAPRAALSVEAVAPTLAQWTTSITGTGAVAPWQEAVVGAELQAVKLVDVHVNVGDVVRKGQVLATLQATSAQADLNASRASHQEAQDDLSEARANAERARSLRSDGVLTARDADRALTAEKTAISRAEAARARMAVDELRLSQTRVVAPDDGVISARQATVGSVVQAGQELFRLIRQQRLEWRAEVPGADLPKLKPGLKVEISGVTGGSPVQGTVRMVSPTVDAATRNGVVYVDLPVAAARDAGLRAGMFASGRFAVGEAQALTLPQTAVLLRDGFSYAFVVQPDQRVRQVKLQVGRRQGDRIEVMSGLPKEARVVASGVSFLSDGDVVQVVKAGPAAQGVAAASATSARKAVQ